MDFILMQPLFSCQWFFSFAKSFLTWELRVSKKQWWYQSGGDVQLRLVRLWPQSCIRVSDVVGEQYWSTFSNRNRSFHGELCVVDQKQTLHLNIYSSLFAQKHFPERLNFNIHCELVGCWTCWSIHKQLNTLQKFSFFKSVSWWDHNLNMLVWMNTVQVPLSLLETCQPLLASSLPPTQPPFSIILPFLRLPTPSGSRFC